jgi:hypothetical protein
MQTPLDVYALFRSDADISIENMNFHFLDFCCAKFPEEPTAEPTSRSSINPPAFDYLILRNPFVASLELCGRRRIRGVASRAMPFYPRRMKAIGGCARGASSAHAVRWKKQRSAG